MAEPDVWTKIYNRDKLAPSEPHETTLFGARCHCSRIKFSITLPTACLPLRALICHCSICRYTSGTFGSMSVNLPPGTELQWINGSSVDKLAGFTKPGGEQPRLFCPSCGTHVGRFDSRRGQWGVAIGLFDEKFWQIRFHAFPRSAPDGGLVEWLPKVGDQDVAHFSPGDQDSPVQSKPDVELEGDERLRAECYCGGVSFAIPRPSQDIVDDDYMKIAVSPTDPAKWKAFLDLCRDCSRTSGPIVIPWLLVPRIVLDSEVPPDLKTGTLQTYQSSKTNTRGFCGVCGATMLLGTTLRMPSERQAVLNVAMGVLRAPEGVKAANWVTWRTGNPAWLNDARNFDEDFADGLSKAHKQWGVENYGENLDFVVI